MATVNGTINSDFIHVAGDGFVAPGGTNEIATATDFDDLVTSGGFGTDTVHAGGGDDYIRFAADLDANDVIDGGGGYDILFVDDQVSVSFGATSLSGIEQIRLAHVDVPVGFAAAYWLTMNDANLASGFSLTIDASSLGSNNFFDFDGSAETGGMFNIYGGYGSDTVKGGAGADDFRMHLGGNDTAISGGGFDRFFFEDALTASDKIAGDAKLGGRVYIGGASYASGLTFLPTTMTNISELVLSNFDSYDLTTGDATVGAGKTLKVYAGGITTADTLDFDGSAETDGKFNIVGGAGNDQLDGGARADTFDLISHHVSGLFNFYTIGGGNDVAAGGGGADLFSGVTGLMQVDGGNGFDTVIARGTGIFDFQVAYGATSLTSIEKIDTGTLSVTLNDANVAAGRTMQVTGSNGGLDGSSETDGHFKFSLPNGGKWLGGNLSDRFETSSTSFIVMAGNGGNDTFKLFGGYSLNHQIDGGGGYDTVTLDCDLSAGVAVTGSMLQNVEALAFANGHSYNLTMEDSAVAPGLLLKADGSALAAGSVLAFDGSTETDGRFRLFGGASADLLTGGALIDTITGGAGADKITGGKAADFLQGDQGKDLFLYNSVVESGPQAGVRDQIKGFTHLSDRIGLSAIDAIAGGGGANDTFQFVGTGPFTAAGQVRVELFGADTLVRISTDADIASEATILLVGIAPATLTAADFVL